MRLWSYPGETTPSAAGENTLLNLILCGQAEPAKKIGPAADHQQGFAALLPLGANHRIIEESPSYSR